MTEHPHRPRLRRSDCSSPGLRRVRRGRGFAYLDEDGAQVTDVESLARVRALTIPPAWKEVWICADPLGHLQATGIDAAGRKQYLYHRAWREKRDRDKFHKMVGFARALPRLRRRVAADLTGADPTRERVLACAARLLDVGLFRIGSEEYAAEEGGGLGLATIGREHVAITRGSMVFDYPAKSGVRRVQAIDDPLSVDLVRVLKRRRGGGPQLLAYREGRRWVSVRSVEVNDYLKQQMGEDFSAKDFRTWNATVLAAVALAVDGGGARTKTARRRAIDGAVRGVAELLGNTPAVARRAYIDPRVFDRYLSGWTIGGVLNGLRDLDAPDDRTRLRIERAVLDLLSEESESRALERVAA
ncbi:MAG: DNA topoisomerase IB [Actinomycetota bacterium]|nr:DNA topoisomerase IB [Actinomycetota bacterium]